MAEKEKKVVYKTTTETRSQKLMLLNVAYKTYWDTDNVINRKNKK